MGCLKSLVILPSFDLNCLFFKSPVCLVGVGRLVALCVCLLVYLIASLLLLFVCLLMCLFVCLFCFVLF